jgi:sporulation protein YlmC with PRC-barrel domain
VPSPESGFPPSLASRFPTAFATCPMFTGDAGEGTEATNKQTHIEEENVASEDRLRELEEKYEDYKVYDNQGERIGKVDDLFVDESDREEYIGVKMGFFGMKSTLIPMDIVRVNEGEKSIEVSDSKDHVKNAPSFDDDEDITPDYEARIRSHFGLESVGTTDAEDDTREYEDRSPLQSQDRTEQTTEASEEPRGYGESRETPEVGTTGGTSAFTDESSGGTPNVRETEETETFREGGRTKIRRRVIREEIIEEDEQDTRNPS